MATSNKFVKFDPANKKICIMVRHFKRITQFVCFISIIFMIYIEYHIIIESKIDLPLCTRKNMDVSKNIQDINIISMDNKTNI